MGRSWVWLGWLAQRAGQGGQSGCRVRNGLIEKPLQLLGGFWDGQGDSSTWVSPLLVPELPSLGWMRVRPRDSAVPRGTTPPDTPARTVTPVAPSGGHCWVPLAQRGWWHLPHGPALTPHMWDLEQAGACAGGGTGPSTRVGQGTLGCPRGGGSAPSPAAPPLRAGCGTGRVQTGWWPPPGWPCGAGEEAAPPRSLSRQHKETGSHFLPGRGERWGGRWGREGGVGQRG